MDKEELEKDKAKIIKAIQEAQAQLLRLDGVLRYINDNLKKEEQDDRPRTDNEE